MSHTHKSPQTLYIVPQDTTKPIKPTFGICLIDQLYSTTSDITVQYNTHDCSIDITTVIDQRDDRIQYIIVSLKHYKYNFKQYNTDIHLTCTVIRNIYLQHAVQCPARRAYMLQLPSNNTSKPIKLASVTLVYDKHERLLLTRRHSKLRTFPRAYVAPGGIVDKYESLQHCAVRELYEETGVVVDDEKLQPVYCWESCYPTEDMELSYPTAQHLIIYFKGNAFYNNIELHLNLSVDEIDQAVWLTPKQVNDIVTNNVNADWATTDSVTTDNTHTTTRSKLIVHANQLIGAYPNEINSGVGKGHLRALQHLHSLQYNKHKILSRIYAIIQTYIATGSGLMLQNKSKQISLTQFLLTFAQTEYAHLWFLGNIATLIYMLRKQLTSNFTTSYVFKFALALNAVSLPLLYHLFNESLKSKYIYQYTLIKYSIATPSEVEHIGQLNATRIASCMLQTSRLLHYTYNIHSEHNILYTDTQTLDVHYCKTNTNQRKPVLLYIHGGALILGNKDVAALSILYTIAHAGWLVVSINYRLLPYNMWPCCLDDCKSAVQWIQQHAKHYNADPNCIVVKGESAGSTLAMLTALHSTTDSIKGVVDIHGPKDFTDLLTDIRRFSLPHRPNNKAVYKDTDISPQYILEHISDYDHITIKRMLTPICSIHGKNDTLVNIDDSIKYYRTLQYTRQLYNIYNDVNDIVIELPTTQHIFANATYNINPRVFATADAISVWLEQIYNSYRLSLDNGIQTEIVPHSSSHSMVKSNL